MGLLTLYTGLLLPWLGGILWLVYFDSYFKNTNYICRFRQAGYGFFLGYAVLFMAIFSVNKLIGAVSWTAILVFLLIFTGSGGLAVWRNRKSVTSTHPLPSSPASFPFRLLLTIMCVLMIVHIAFISIEVFTLPVFPWDAWLAWVYRAKAWFMSGTMTDLVSAADWAASTTASVHTMDAWHYPLFPSVIPYWAALSLGHWSETLINLPVLFAGLAIGMALYGQCREHGLTVSVSLILCYLLYSIPLFATHLSLAGYADIWMAGFTGLGFVALIQGFALNEATGKSWPQLITGFSMILFSICVKNEGSVWFLAAMAMLILVVFRPRVPILIIVTFNVLVLLGFALGITYIDIPLIGKLGLIDKHLVVPFIGKFGLTIHDIRNVYWDNFINMGSWNLVWVLVAASLFLGLKPNRAISGFRARRSATSFILIFLTTQVFIFGFTNQGQWADTYTAINRLPLQFIPALLFAAAVIANASLIQIDAMNSTPETQSGEV